MRPFAFILSDTATPVSRAQLVVHCLLVETDDGLVLVEAGYGIADRTRPARLERVLMALSGSSRDLTETAARQVVGLGYAIEDVRRVVLTHLHLDHAGGLPDFPQAHVYRASQNDRFAHNNIGSGGRPTGDHTQHRRSVSSRAETPWQNNRVLTWEGVSC